MFLAIRREGQIVSRMQEVDGRQEERMLAVDEFGNESWVPAERISEEGTGFRRAVEAQRQPTRLQQAARVQAQQQVIEVELDQETTSENTTQQGNGNDRAAGAGAVDTQGQRVPGFWATNAGAGVTFFALWIAAGMLGSFCRVFGPDAMIVGYLVGVVLWWGGYFWYLRWWYRSQPWQVVKATVLVELRDSRGRVRVDRRGRVLTEEQERVVIQELNGRLYVKGWRPFTYKWLKPQELGLTEEEVRGQYGQD